MTKHTIEPASSGRAKCRGCDEKIAKGELRLGERLPNPFSDKQDMTHWFHLKCAAYKRPETWLETINEHQEIVGASLRSELASIADEGTAHKRLSRVNGGQRASSGRAKCRHCRESISKGTMRISLVFYEDGRFNPSGYIHPACAAEYLGTKDVVNRVHHFSPDLSPADLEELKADLDG